MGSDGLFDNIFVSDIIKIVNYYIKQDKFEMLPKILSEIAFEKSLNEKI